MIKTEKKYWRNGFERRGTFWTLTLSLGRFGLMICKPNKYVKMFDFYQLT